MKECFVCKSDVITEGTTAQTYQENGHIVVIKSIPCLVCKTCGETYLTTDTMRRVESFLNTVKWAEIEIVSYETVAA
jgi:YgiT-type zinc finger domain-containing protein